MGKCSMDGSSIWPGRVESVLTYFLSGGMMDDSILYCWYDSCHNSIIVVVMGIV